MAGDALTQMKDSPLAAYPEQSGPALRQARLGPADLKEAIFGSFDGMTSTLGVVAGLLATHAAAPKIVAASIGIAVAATVGMGAGQYLSDGARNVRNAVVIGTSERRE
jgi:hypothetical protein